MPMYGWEPLDPPRPSRSLLEREQFPTRADRCCRAPLGPALPCISCTSQFATTLTVAIAVSLLFSLAFLPAALCVLGPDGDTGSILPAVQALGLGFLCGLHDEIDSDKGRQGRKSGAVAVVGAEAQNDAPRASATAAAV